MATILLHTALLLLFPPLLLGVIGKTKAFFAGRVGPPVWQAYFDVGRLLRKGAVYSRTTTWVFRTGPIVALAATVCAGLLVPSFCRHAPLEFQGDVLLFAYLLGLGRFFTMAAALDTGSSFEGMGASREATFSALAEPALLLAIAIICVPVGQLSFGEAWTALPWATWGTAHPAYAAAALALFIVLLAENSRIPVDDPNTHLELTMVHEVMVLDHSGPDLAFILYGSCLKLYVLASLLVQLLLPIPEEGGGLGLLLSCGAQIGMAIAVGVLESVMARLRMPRVPQFLVAASVVAMLGLATVLYRGAP